jgi:hypothetical protein
MCMLLWQSEASKALPASLPVLAALLSLRDRLCRLDLRTSSSSSLQQLWQCPQGQHLTAIAVPPAADAAAAVTAAAGLGSGASEHLLAAATSAGALGSGSSFLLFDLRRPRQPVASWQQPPMDQRQHEAPTLLRWLHAAAAEAAPAAAAAQPGSLVVAGSGSGGWVVGCQFASQVPSAAGSSITAVTAVTALCYCCCCCCDLVLAAQDQPLLSIPRLFAPGPPLLLLVQAPGSALQARGGQIAEKPASSGASLLERLQAELVHQQEERGDGMDVDREAAASAQQQPQQEQQQEEQQRATVPPQLQAPPALPIPLQLLWQPVHSEAVTAAPGPPMLLVPPLGQQPALSERLSVGRLMLQKQQAAAGGCIQASSTQAAGSPVVLQRPGPF